MTDQIKESLTAGTAGAVTRRSLLLSLPGLALAQRLLGQGQAAPLAVRGLHQITLAVSDLERSLDFYQAVFGMAVQARHQGKILKAQFEHLVSPVRLMKQHLARHAVVARSGRPDDHILRPYAQNDVAVLLGLEPLQELRRRLDLELTIAKAQPPILAHQGPGN